MKIYNIYFSPTGGTKKVTDILCSVWEEEKQEIDLAVFGADYKRYTFEKEDICIVGVPSYGGRVPKAALDALGQMNGRGARAVLAAVYGNRAYDDTLLELREALTGAGFHCTAAIAAVAEHSVMRQFGAGRPDEADRAELQGFAGSIKEKLEKQDREGEVKVPGNKPYRSYNGIPLKPKANRSCTKCGVCAEKCPVGAIARLNPSETDKETCISCMRCISVCPQKARGVNNIMLKAAAAKMKKTCSGRKENEIFPA